MKNLSFLLLLLSLSCCNPKDCLESTGTIIQEEINLAPFDKINIGNEVTLILKQGLEQKVILETGKNLLNGVKVEVINDKLFMTDDNSCNYIRDYAVTKVYVTSPNIVEIRSNTARKIVSEGILSYPDLLIYSENFHEESLTNGDIDLNVNIQNLKFVSNGSSIFTIQGNTDNLNITFASGSSRFNGKNLVANNITINQKSTNDMLVNPINKLEGNIYSIGDVISYNMPSIVNMNEYYSGKLIFE